MMMRSPLLQDFDAADTATPDTHLPSPVFNAGYAKGIEDGRAQAHLDAELMTAAAAQAIADMEFGYAEARAHFLALLEPLFEALTARLLPDIARETLPAHIAAVLKSAAFADVLAPIDILVHPDSAAQLERLANSSDSVPFRVSIDRDLGLGQAHICAPEGEGTALVVDGVVRDIAASLAALFEKHDERIA